MNGVTSDLIMDVRHGECPVTRSPSSECNTRSVVLYSPGMDFCMDLQLALENQYQIVTTTDLEMLMMLVNTFKPDLVMMRASPSLSMKRYITMMKRAFPNIRILLFVSSRMFDLIAISDMRKLVDGVLAEPVVITELTRIMKSLLHE